MAEGIQVVEYISGHIYESKKLAGEALNIPVRIIDKSLAKKGDVVYKNKIYRFALNFEKGKTHAESIIFPFGKYKRTKIKECTDKDYIIWLIKQSFVDMTLRAALKKRLMELDK